MEIDHVHFYVEDAPSWRNWCCQTLGFQSLGGWSSQDTHTEVVVQGQITFVCSSSLSPSSPVAAYLRTHPPGVADLALRVTDLNACLQRAKLAGAEILQAPQQQAWPQGQAEFAQIPGCGSLRHTLVQREGITGVSPFAKAHNLSTSSLFTHVDHAVLNVAASEFVAAIAWYEKVLGFQRQQRFEIQTQHSGLCSQVLVHPEGGAQLPVNAPTGENSQIQEFLDHHRGAGIQHLALHTPNLVAATQQVRQKGLPLLSTPTSYYEHLAQVWQNHPDVDVNLLAQEQILADWQVEPQGSVLLQIFSQPIFGQPTFFLELIERRQQAQGFGEGNFLALFKAIEREQLLRATIPAKL